MQSTSGFTWTPKVAEELLFRSLMHHENITAMTPPPPTVERGTIAHHYEQATKPLRHFFSLPAFQSTAPASSSIATTDSSSVKTVLSVPPPMMAQQQQSKGAALMPSSLTSAVSKSAAVTAASLRTPKNREMTPPPPTTATTVAMSAAPSTPKAMAPGTPKGQAGTPTALKRARSEAESPRSRKVRFEWPADVPNNAMLKGKTKAQLTEATSQRMEKQQCFDADLIFRQPQTEFPLQAIFAQHPKAVRMIATMRGTSGDWHDDTFSREEEDLYKEECGVLYRGTSQVQLPPMAGAMAQVQKSMLAGGGPSSLASSAKSTLMGGLDAVYKALPAFHHHAPLSKGTLDVSPEITFNSLGKA